MSVAIPWTLVAILAIALVALQRRTAAARRAQDAERRSIGSDASRSRSAEREALRLGRILAAMPDGVMVIEGGTVAYANPAAARLLGGDPVRLVPTIRSATKPSIVVTVHHPVFREVRCLRTELDAGAILVVASDVTEAQRLDRMRQDFVANASHELKTPVAAIRATAETLRSAIDDDLASARRFVDTLGREANRLVELVQDLLDLARLDRAGDASEHGERSDAAAAARAAVDAVAMRAHDAGITIAMTGEETWVSLRASDLELALRNLLDNALRHTPSGGRIQVEIGAADARATILVRDSGEGIPAKDLPRIFERFYRVDPARSRDTGGTGLGLAIVKHVVETAGGAVSVESIFGSGSTFTLRLPTATATGG